MVFLSSVPIKGNTGEERERLVDDSLLSLAPSTMSKLFTCRLCRSDLRAQRAATTEQSVSSGNERSHITSTKRLREFMTMNDGHSSSLQRNRAEHGMLQEGARTINLNGNVYVLL